VGLSLPLVQGRASSLLVLTSGVVSGPKGVLPWLAALFGGRLSFKRGFPVAAQAAVELLASVHPEAAAWWRTNTPHLLKGKRYLVFPEGVGHVLESPSAA
jgi:hypothetical protein